MQLKPRWLPGLLWLFAFTLFARTLWGDFLRWDDRQHILFNPWLTHFMLTRIWSESYFGLYIPTTYSVWALIYQWSHEPWAFHLLNVTLHACNTVLVYYLVQNVERTNSPTHATVAALIFASHPLQVATVAWISAGRDLLCVLFSLVALLLFLRARARWQILLATLCFALALLAKPLAVVIPPVAWLLERNRISRDKNLTLVLWLFLAIACAWITRHVQGPEVEVRGIPPGVLERLVLAIDAAGFYLLKFFVPLSLSADYSRTPQFVWEQASYLLTGIVAVIFAGIYWRTEKHRESSRWLACAGMALAPVIGLIPFAAQFDSTVADRYAYLPIAFFAAAITPLILRVSWLPVTVIAAISLMTSWASGYWLNNDVFFAHLYELNPRSYLATNSLGVSEMLKGNLKAAESLLKTARILKPSSAVAAANLGQVYWSAGRAEALLADLEPLIHDPQFLRANQEEDAGMSALYRQIARAEWKLGMWEKAHGSYCLFKRRDPENVDGNNEFLNFLSALAKQGRPIAKCEEIIP